MMNNNDNNNMLDKLETLDNVAEGVYFCPSEDIDDFPKFSIREVYAYIREQEKLGRKSTDITAKELAQFIIN